MFYNWSKTEEKFEREEMVKKEQEVFNPRESRNIERSSRRSMSSGRRRRGVKSRREWMVRRTRSFDESVVWRRCRKSGDMNASTLGDWN